MVDNASTDSPAEVAADWKGAHRFIALGENVGFGAASNVGVENATGNATVLLNPDTELLDDGLDRLAAEALRLRGLVGPRVLNPDGSIQPSASGPEVGPWPWVRALVPAALQPASIRARTEPYRLERPVEVTWLTGACIAGPTEVLARLGPFDPALHMFGEDIDLGLRAAAGGVSSWFGSARLSHRPPRPGLVDAGLRLARGLATDRDPELARGTAARLRPPPRVARLAGAAREPAPAARGQDAARARRGPRPRRGRGGRGRPPGARAAEAARPDRPGAGTARLRAWRTSSSSSPAATWPRSRSCWPSSSACWPCTSRC